MGAGVGAGVGVGAEGAGAVGVGVSAARVVVAGERIFGTRAKSLARASWDDKTCSDGPKPEVFCVREGEASPLPPSDMPFTSESKQKSLYDLRLKQARHKKNLLNKLPHCAW